MSLVPCGPQCLPLPLTTMVSSYILVTLRLRVREPWLQKGHSLGLVSGMFPCPGICTAQHFAVQRFQAHRCRDRASLSRVLCVLATGRLLSKQRMQSRRRPLAFLTQTGQSLSGISLFQCRLHVT